MTKVKQSDRDVLVEGAGSGDNPGLLPRSVGRVELNMLLEIYLRELAGRAFRDVKAVYLFGSALQDDLSPAHGDIDLLVVLPREPGSSFRREIEAVHRYLASELFAPWGRMLDVHYLPLAALKDRPPPARGLNGKRGDVEEEKGRALSPLSLFLVREHGQLLYGTDVRRELHVPSRRELLDQLKEELGRARELDGSEDVHRYVSVFTSGPRLLHILKTGTIASKTECARGFAVAYAGKIADGILESIRIRRGESYSGLSNLRRAVQPYTEAIDYEIRKLEDDLKRHPELAG